MFNQHKTLRDLSEDLEEEGLSFILTEWEYDDLKALHEFYVPEGPNDENKHWLGELIRLFPGASEFSRVIYDELKLPDYTGDELDGAGEIDGFGFEDEADQPNSPFQKPGLMDDIED